MSTCDTIITFSESKNEFSEPPIFGNGWGLFIKLDDDESAFHKKEIRIDIGLESEKDMYIECKYKNKNNYFEHVYESVKLILVMFISAVFVFIVFYF